MRKLNGKNVFPEVPASVHRAVLDALDRLEDPGVIGTEERKENRIMFPKKKNRYTAAAVVGAAALAVCSVTGYAALKYLTPSQAALEVNDHKLAAAFQREDAVLIDESQKYDDYIITLLGVASGADISDYISSDMALGDKAMYAVLAMERTDGEPMPDTDSDEYGSVSFFASPYIQGLEPGKFNIYTLGTGYSEFVEDGIQYRLLQFDDLSVFADRILYIGVNEGTTCDVSAYLYDETTGKISKNPDYDGLNALFTLPIDASCADEEAAQAYIDRINAEWNSSDSGSESRPEMTDEEKELNAFMSGITGENIGEHLERVEQTVQTLTPDSDGYIEYSWHLENGAGSENASLYLDWLDLKAGETIILGWSSSGGIIEGLCVETLTDNGDGTYTFAVYAGQDGAQ